MADEFKKVYKDQVEVKYIDVDKVGSEDYPILERVLRMGYSYPITLINGQPKFAGAVMIPEIKIGIDEILKETD